MRSPVFRALALLALSAGAACAGGAPADLGADPGGGGGSGGSGGPVVLGGLFEAPNAWNQPVDTAPLAPWSATAIAWLAANGGFGTGTFRVDFSIALLEAGASTPRVDVTPGDTFWTPDCDLFPMPLPPGGAVEGEDGYGCAGGGDCHLLVLDRAARRLYELSNADLSGGVLRASCGVVWDLERSYPPELRGDQCTSVDAAGLPVAALLFTADELAAGAIEHAIRFTLPNPRMRARSYVRPATHAGAPSGPAEAPPYGSRFRLRADFPVAGLPSEGARVVARALQRYGMILADGGNIALTAADDRFTAHRWSEVGFDTYSLRSLRASDFEIVDPGPVVPLTYDCARNGY